MKLWIYGQLLNNANLPSKKDEKYNLMKTSILLILQKFFTPKKVGEE